MGGQAAEGILEHLSNTTAFSAARGKGNYADSRIEERLSKYQDAYEAYKRSLDKLAQAEQEAYAYTQAICGIAAADNYRDVLQLRYICLLDDDAICRRICCSKPTLRRWVAGAFSWFDERSYFETHPPKWIM